MISPTAADRVRERIERWIEAADISYGAFATTVGNGFSKEWLQKILTKENQVRLRDLDAVAARMHSTASELVRSEEDRYTLELTPTELRIVQRLRQKPHLIDALLLVFFDIKSPTVPQKSTPKAKRVTRKLTESTGADAI